MRLVCGLILISRTTYIIYRAIHSTNEVVTTLKTRDCHCLLGPRALLVGVLGIGPMAYLLSSNRKDSQGRHLLENSVMTDSFSMTDDGRAY